MFKIYAVLRDLHTFPTRRSSDLFFEPGTAQCAAGFVVYGPQTMLVLAHSASVEDRKSTRLNSSHVKISYAVFCLKKKRTSPDYRCQLRFLCIIRYLILSRYHRSP